ncbi:alpha-glucuronidase family glycosyl hydrolase [uncultured Draconibacterium sp.]|uniref:alpha-glucuronidase family glycosyl hydrolase n=1 Tax=uncultured Draconibacterium sp. TaxID=1573823 RepID=UPI0029C925C9|nr:alpha-glucuronidase family glycosyl hydrolase [uncultured Draconibacterium sp.]
MVRLTGKLSLLNLFLACFGAILFSAYPLSAKEIQIFADENEAHIQFAVSEISKVLQKNEFLVEHNPLQLWDETVTESVQIVMGLSSEEKIKNYLVNKNCSPDSLQDEGFMIRVSNEKNLQIVVVAKDYAGLMYGGFELAEIISGGGMESVKDQFQNPYKAMRGVKFNIPLDVRTPSYTDVSDAAQHNITEMWNFDFWKEYIDSLAKFRYNYISLWSLHPFPSVIKVSDYPDIALDDVHRSTVDWKENYNLNGIGFDSPEIVNNYEVLKRMTIDEKIDFWQRVMRYGKERNVDFYLVTWNIFTNGTFGKYGITDELENPVTKDYFRKSVKQLFLSYPDLAGVGLTTGENMYRYSTKQKEDWAFDTYGQAVLDVVKEQPDRKITFIHRQHQTGALDIADKFAPLINHPNINFIFSYKYAKAHVYSSTKQVYHQDFVEEISRDKNLKTIWTLRNDDVFHFRWGAPDFVREFIKNIPYDVSKGYYYGSDQYIWGREFLSKTPERPRQTEIAKHWYHWMLWGRLGYNPEMKNEQILDILQSHFPETDASILFNAWQNASMIYPLTTGFHWGSLDFQWYIESGHSRPAPAETPSGYHDINRFISLPPHKGTNYMSIPEYVDFVENKKSSTRITPVELAGEINEYADKALSGVETFKGEIGKELRQTLEDIQSISYLGKYYAYKILAATNLALFRATLDVDYREKMLQALNQSAGYWRYYASLSLSNYQNPLWTNRVGYVDWRKTYDYVLYDITANGGKPEIASMNTTKGGTILEAEKSDFHYSTVSNVVSGFTGSGYLDYRSGDAKQDIEWTVDAPSEGMYALEFRYSLKRQEDFVCPVVINGKEVGEITFWMTGSTGCWCWDRISVRLPNGKNTIKISPEGFVMLDHLNVLKE